MLYIKTKFFRICDCNKFITVCSLKNNELKKKLDELDEMIERGAKMSDIPPDTSKFKDEFNLSYAQKRGKIVDAITHNTSLIKQYENKIDYINETINSLPDCMYKTIIQDYYMGGDGIKEITYKNRCCKQTVYNLVHKIESGWKNEQKI